MRPGSGFIWRVMVAACALTLLTVPSASAAIGEPADPAPPGQPGKLGPFRGDGMWIWYISQSNKGNLDSIADQAERRGIEVLYIKSSDGTSPWSQFTPQMIDFFHKRGLRVCGWQYVYGKNPKGEAKAAATAAKRGADCFVIDAETEYEGRYVAALRYMRSLRDRAGADFPIGFTSFPYVDYHPWMPYSVFLREGASTVNLPQIYWRAIGSSVASTIRHTHVHNRIYEVPIAPIGQTYQDPAANETIRFRRLARGYAMRGVSWWSWQDTSKRNWKAVGQSIKKMTDRPPGFRNFPVLRTGYIGDQVIWAQSHLNGAGASLPVTGYMGNQTTRAARSFQKKQGIPVTGAIDGPTWRKLLKVTPRQVNWVREGNPSASSRIAAARSAFAGAQTIMEMPATPGRP